jgi:2-desacetyl-2-hydroxyethyl bacteriochlorophyllide A dehydrogenase
MRAGIFDAPGEVRTGVVPDPTPRPDEVVVRVSACGICGTDLHIFAGDNPLAHYPVVPGHEFAGEVVALGSRAGQTGIAVGSKVAVDPNLNCGYCEQCRAGRQNLCLNYRAIGVSINGGIAEYVAVPEKKAYLLPDSMSYPNAALIEPVACAVHGMHGMNPKSGDTFLIAGAGTMGLLLLQLAVRGGASRVSVIDLQARRLSLAEQLGACRTYGDVESALADEPLGFNCVIDTTGVPTVMEHAFWAVKRGGKFMIFGVAPYEARVSLSPFRIYNEEIAIVGSMAVQNSFQGAIDLIRSGVISTQDLLSTRFALKEFPQALEHVRRGEGLKTQVIVHAD